MAQSITTVSNVVMLSVIMLKVIMLSVVIPKGVLWGRLYPY